MKPYAGKGQSMPAGREADLVRRVLTLAKDHPEATKAPAALNWAFGELLGGYFGKSTAACDAICKAVERFLDRPEILPLVGGIWVDARLGSPGPAVPGDGPEAKSNRDIQGTACYSLAKAHERIAEAYRILNDPVRRRDGPSKLWP